MNTRSAFLVGLAALAAQGFGFPSTASAQTILGPVRVTAADLAQAPYASTGVVDIVIGRNGYRGSGSVARDPRIIYTCGHNVFENGTWASTLRFARAWNGSGDAPDSSYVTLRGFRHMTGYSDAVTRYGQDSNQAFAADFAVGFGTATSNFGNPLPVLVDGVTPLRSTAQKMIVGYPAELDHTGSSGGYYQHRTGPFTAAASVILNPFLDFNRIVTGPGNSGGPTLVSQNGVWTVAGILVAGSSSTAGVFGLTSAANNVATEAITAAGGTVVNPPPPTTDAQKSIANSQAALLADGSTKYVARHFSVSGLPTYATGVKLTLSITTPFRGDLDVYLRSPSGRIRWVAQHNANDGTANLSLSQEDLSDSFVGSNPNGRWTLYMRDFYRGDRARYQGATLTVSAR
ncbi:MAG: proprotein convertase P-domain-containing protein [Verrucomicrobiales bacterium]|nr:proprotein convertase P-domain-containing protein [Verrucomicrobiales bacterium]